MQIAPHCINPVEIIRNSTSILQGYNGKYGPAWTGSHLNTPAPIRPTGRGIKNADSAKDEIAHSRHTGSTKSTEGTFIVAALCGVSAGNYLDIEGCAGVYGFETVCTVEGCEGW